MTISIHSHPAVSDAEFMAYWQARKAAERIAQRVPGRIPQVTGAYLRNNMYEDNPPNLFQHRHHKPPASFLG